MIPGIGSTLDQMMSRPVAGKANGRSSAGPEAAPSERAATSPASFEKTLESRVAQKPLGQKPTSQKSENVRGPLPNPMGQANENLTEKAQTSDPKFFVEPKGSPNKVSALTESAADQESEVDDNAPVKEFMLTMQKELGVPPEALVVAMTRLTPDELMQSPQESMNAFLDQLDIEGPQRGRAEVLYKKMISDLTKQDLGQQLTPASQIQVLAPDDLRREKMLSSINRMTDQFFLNDRMIPYKGVMRNEDPLDGAQAVGGVSETAATSPQALSDGIEGEASDFEAVSPQTLAGTAGKNSEPYSQSAMALQANQAIAKGQSPQSGAGSAALGSTEAIDQVEDGSGEDSELAEASTTSSGFTLGRVLGGGLTGAVVGAGIAANGATNSATASQTPAQSTPLATVTQGFAKGNGNSQGSTTSLKNVSEKLQSLSAEKEGIQTDPSSAKSKDSAGLEGMGFSLPAEAKAGGTLGMASVAQKGNAAAGVVTSDQVNINEVIRNATTVIKNGGGEMKMKLSPEGLGDLHLKVQVADGRVNIEMLTQNNDAKRILESSLSDLKSSLETQRLAVDGFKVDVADKTSQSQAQNHSQGDLSRNMAREFLGQFRDQNQSNRSGFYEAPGFRMYRSNGENAKNIEPVSGGARRSAQASRRLDLVA